MAGTFTIEDIRLLEKTISIRERIVDNLICKELPTSPRDVEVLTGTLESIDRSIFSKVKINLEETSNKVNEETKGVLMDILTQIHTKKIVHTTSTESKQPAYTPTGVDVSDGELIPKIDHVDVKAYLEQT